MTSATTPRFRLTALRQRLQRRYRGMPPTPRLNAVSCSRGERWACSRGFGRNCLLARRLVESGVRFVQFVHASWDHHAELKKSYEQESLATDKPSAALVADLKQRGLLDSTLVVWGEEFGRTPMVEDRTPSCDASRGRDHHRPAFSIWLAGGGIRPGRAVGRTDDFVSGVTEDPVAANDLQATLLHSLGLGPYEADSSAPRLRFPRDRRSRQRDPEVALTVCPLPPHFDSRIGNRIHRNGRSIMPWNRDRHPWVGSR